MRALPGSSRLCRTLAVAVVGAVAGLAGPACKQVDCGDGTVERGGRCEPADQTVTNATCGPFTELQGDQCVPQFPPTVCDPQTSVADVDPATGVTTCIGTGTGGCSAPFACPAPVAGRQTICGQLYDLASNQPFAATGATGAQCPTTPTATGPCSLGIRAYDAIEFASNPAAAQPRATGAVYLDDCGRYRVPDIDPPAGPFIGLGVDDAVPASQGPAGTTNIVGTATPKQANMATRELDGWVVPKSTTDQWAASGGPAISTGYYVPIFRAASTGQVLQPGVAVTRSAAMIPANDFYFTAAQTTRQTVDVTATVTGANGTALVDNASIADGVAYSGTGALPATCQWSTHAGATLPGIVFIQVVRPVNAVGQTCPL